jgi:predicted amidohydrolase YtcJ
MTHAIALVNGRAHSLDASARSYQALAIESGRITRVGDSTDLRTYAAERAIPVIDLNGRVVLPGAIDTHFHLTLTGMHLASVDFSGCRSVDEVLQVLREHVSRGGHGRWIVGKGLEEFNLREKRPPSAPELDRVCASDPVFIEDRGHHYIVVNSLAFSRLGIPPESRGVRRLSDGSGISGQLMEEVMGSARRALLSFMDADQRRDMLVQGAAYAARCGVTTLHAIEGGPATGDHEIPLLYELKDQLPARVKVYWCTTDLAAVTARGERAFGGDILLDGNLGARTAALLTPYADAASHTGELYYSQEEITRLVGAAARAGLQIGFHAIGDRAIEQALVAFEAAARQDPPIERPFRLDHFGVPTRDQVTRAAALGVVIATQPPFPFRRSCPGGVYESRLGKERVQRAYPLRELKDAGLLVAGGSDSSVMPADYMFGIHSAVNHPYADQRLTPAEALQLYTLDAARLGFEESQKGTLTVGKLGDVVVLDNDPLAVAPTAIQDIRVEMTIRGGEVVFDRQLQ